MKLVRALDSLETELNQRLADFTHPILGVSTLNVGLIEGGTRANIIPDRAAAQIDIRFVPALVTDTPSALDFVEACVTGLDLPLTVSRPTENPPMEVPADHEWLARLQAIHPSSRLVGAPWFSDAAHLNAGGIPSVCLGPGSIDQAHTKDEFIELAELERGAHFFAKLVPELGRGPG